MGNEQIFGQYILLDRISAGGMAEIFKAKTQGIGGFEKLLAIKRIHHKHSEDDKFIKMMVDEAKITVRLNHVNIAQIFDLGQIEGMYYIAMEYIDGRDLYKVMRRCQDKGRLLPVEASVFIAHELCAGLDYAHTKRDEHNRPLGIVHRDVSPQNVIISVEGQVKLVDFGIAKHAIRSRETDAGIIKGKFSYMSPEQAWGDPFDHRTDIFSTGIILYELLTGAMLYSESDELKLLDRIRKADIQPPRRLKPEVSAELESIVMKALHKRPEARYQAAHEFQTALARFLYTRTPGFSVSKMSQLMRDLFPEVSQPVGPRRQTLSLGLMSREEFPTGTAGSLLEEHVTSVGEARAGAGTNPGAESDDDEPTRVWDRRRVKTTDSTEFEETPVGEPEHGYMGTGLRKAPAPAQPKRLRTETGEYELLDSEDIEEVSSESSLPREPEPTVVDAVSPFFREEQARAARPAEKAAEPEVPPWEETEEDYTDVFTPPGGKAAAPGAPRPAAPAPAAPPGAQAAWREKTPGNLWEAAAVAEAPPAAEPRASRQPARPQARPLQRDTAPRARAAARPRRTAPVLWFGAAVLLAGGGVAIWWGTREPEPPPRPPVAAGEPAVPERAPLAPPPAAPAQPPAAQPLAAPPPPAQPVAAQPSPAEPPAAQSPAAKPEPKPRPARVLVATKPVGATVYVDGEMKGEAGTWLDLEAGRTYEIEVRKRGYRLAAQTVEASEGDQRLFFALEKARRPRRRVVRRRPKPAPVAAEPVAAAPATPEPATATEAPAPKPEAPAAEPKPEAPAAAEPKPDAPLPPHGFVSVNARPWGEVYIDGSKVSNQTPLLRFRLRPGVHRVRVFFVTLGRYSAERKLLLNAGESKTVFFKE